MDKIAHIIIGAAAVAVLAVFMSSIAGWHFDAKELITIIIVTYLFCLLPDIDHPISTITWHFLGIGIAGLVISFFSYGQNLMFASIVLLVLTFLCAQFAGHRGPIHTVWAGALFAIPLYLIFHDYRLCIIAWVAYYSHLAADGYWFKTS